MSQNAGNEQKYETSLITISNAAQLVAACVVALDVNKDKSNPGARELTLESARTMAVARFKNALKIPTALNQ